jgi:hypothetical protein
MLAIVLVSTGVLLLLAVFEFPVLDKLTPRTAVLLGFAMSFPSTVFAVKLLEDKDEMANWFGLAAVSPSTLTRYSQAAIRRERHCEADRRGANRWLTIAERISHSTMHFIIAHCSGNATPASVSGTPLSVSNPV